MRGIYEISNGFIFFVIYNDNSIGQEMWHYFINRKSRKPFHCPFSRKAKDPLQRITLTQINSGMGLKVGAIEDRAKAEIDTKLIQTAYITNSIVCICPLNSVDQFGVHDHKFLIARNTDSEKILSACIQ